MTTPRPATPARRRTAVSPELRRLERRLGFRFNDPGLLEEAFTHRSYVNETPGVVARDNERLEFLGDAILDLIVAEYAFKANLAYDEGQLTIFRSAVVKTDALAEMARAMELGHFLRLGRGIDPETGRQQKSLLANVLEALVGAIYLDQGYERATEFFLKRMGRAGAQTARDANYKGRLQELCQDRRWGHPTYQLISAHGPGHAPVYVVHVTVDGRKWGAGVGGSKQTAEQEAAKEGLQALEALPVGAPAKPPAGQKHGSSERPSPVPGHARAPAAVAPATVREAGRRRRGGRGRRGEGVAPVTTLVPAPAAAETPATAPAKAGGLRRRLLKLIASPLLRSVSDQVPAAPPEDSTATSAQLPAMATGPRQRGSRRRRGSTPAGAGAVAPTAPTVPVAPRGGRAGGRGGRGGGIPSAGVLAAAEAGASFAANLAAAYGATSTGVPPAPVPMPRPAAAVTPAPAQPLAPASPRPSRSRRRPVAPAPPALVPVAAASTPTQLSGEEAKPMTPAARRRLRRKRARERLAGEPAPPSSQT